MFVFQACYGVPGDYYSGDVYVEGTVRDSLTHDPIPGIKIETEDRHCFSDEQGNYLLFIQATNGSYTLSFRDVDGELNGRYQTKDTVLQVQQDTMRVDMLLIK